MLNMNLCWVLYLADERLREGRSSSASTSLEMNDPPAHCLLPRRHRIVPTAAETVERGESKTEASVTTIAEGTNGQIRPTTDASSRILVAILDFLERDSMRKLQVRAAAIGLKALASRQSKKPNKHAIRPGAGVLCRASEAEPFAVVRYLHARCIDRHRAWTPRHRHVSVSTYASRLRDSACDVRCTGKQPLRGRLLPAVKRVLVRSQTWSIPPAVQYNDLRAVLDSRWAGRLVRTTNKRFNACIAIATRSVPQTRSPVCGCTPLSVCSGRRTPGPDPPRHGPPRGNVSWSTMVLVEKWWHGPCRMVACFPADELTAS
jgi:hypothetical protein